MSSSSSSLSSCRRFFFFALPEDDPVPFGVVAFAFAFPPFAFGVLADGAPRLSMCSAIAVAVWGSYLLSGPVMCQVLL